MTLKETVGDRELRNPCPHPQNQRWVKEEWGGARLLVCGNVRGK